MREWISSQMLEIGLDADLAYWLLESLDVLWLVLAAVGSYYLAQRIVVRLIRRLAIKTQFDWDDILIEHQAFRRLSHIIPALTIHILAPSVFATESFAVWTARLAEIYMLAAVLSTANILLTAGLAIYNNYEIARRFPIQVYIQVVKVLLAAAAAIIAVAIITDQHPLLLLSGLGAMTAILLLVSRDSLQGLVAGIQLVGNDMVRVGDWIEMPKYGADGPVIAITMNTVKVQNWDKTISMIPTYSMVSESFKNWRGMSEAGGRRIKRSIYIDTSSVQFCDEEMIERCRQLDLLRDYIDAKRQELAEYNQARGVSESTPINGRRLTNIGLFRQYLVGYLRTHPMINQELTQIVRQMHPTEHGLPLQIYAFSSNTDWVPHEAIQSDIFDHVLAAVPEFGLRVFQTPSGQDIEGLARSETALVASGSPQASPLATPSTPADDC